MKLAAALLVLLSGAAFGQAQWGADPGTAKASPAGPKPSGTDMIYLWFLPTARGVFPKSKVSEIVGYGNAYLGKMGVKTRMAGVIMDKGFSKNFIAPRNSIVAVGDKEQVIEAALKAGVLAREDVGYAQTEWGADEHNPETARKRKDAAHGLGWTFISAPAAVKFSKWTMGKATPAQMLALIAIHGAGHESGLSHLNSAANNTTPNFMDNGVLMLANIAGNSGGLLMPGDDGVLQTFTAQKCAIEDLFNAKQLSSRGPDKSFDGQDEARWQARYRRRFAKDPPPMPTQRSYWTSMLGDDAAVPAEFCKAAPSPCVF